MATIKKKRPDVLKDIGENFDGVAIQEQAPPRVLEQHVDNIADIGQPITACFMTSSSVDPTNW